MRVVRVELPVTVWRYLWVKHKKGRVLLYQSRAIKELSHNLSPERQVQESHQFSGNIELVRERFMALAMSLLMARISVELFCCS